MSLLTHAAISAKSHHLCFMQMFAQAHDLLTLSKESNAISVQYVTLKSKLKNNYAPRAQWRAMFYSDDNRLTQSA